MTIIEWLVNSISAAILLGGATFLARNLITTRLTKAVEHDYNVRTRAIEHDFNTKLGELSSAQRKSEEELKSDLKRRELEISTLQSGILSGRTARLSAVDKRRLEAIDQMWIAVDLLRPLLPIAGVLAVVKIDDLADEIRRNPRAKEILEPFDIDMDRVGASTKAAHAARPYVTDLAWAYFVAYSVILSIAATTARLLKTGFYKPEYFDHKKLKELVVAALPHSKDYLEKFGMNASYNLLEQITDLLVDEFRKMMDGAENDLDGVRRARTILEAASKANAASTTAG